MQSGIPAYIDIFAGAGGISLGLYNAGWRGLFAIEKSGMAFDTLQYNLIRSRNHFLWPIWLPCKNHDINEILFKYHDNLIKLKGKVKLVVGGPPCQGFSTAGQRKYNDDRNQLVKSYLKFVELVDPEVVFLENVTGFSSNFNFNEKHNRSYSEYVKRKLKLLNYDVSHEIIDFSEFGIPQKRKRFILIGFKNYDSKIFFNKLNKSRENFLKLKGLKKNPSLGCAISDLEKKHGIKPFESRFSFGIYGPIESQYQKYMRTNVENSYPDSHRFVNHRKTTIMRSNYILENCPRNIDVRDEVKKIYNLKKHSLRPLDKNRPCPTLTTLPDDYIHYSEPRILTVREYARLQSFPDWYEIKNKYTTGGKKRQYEVPRYTQVGNAVPPLFVEQAGIVIKEILNV